MYVNRISQKIMKDNKWTPELSETPDSFLDILEKDTEEDLKEKRELTNGSNCMPEHVKNKVMAVLAGFTMEDVEKCIQAESFDEAMLYLNRNKVFKNSDIKWLKLVFEQRKKKKK